MVLRLGLLHRRWRNRSCSLWRSMATGVAGGFGLVLPVDVRWPSFEQLKICLLQSLVFSGIPGLRPNGSCYVYCLFPLNHGRASNCWPSIDLGRWWPWFFPLEFSGAQISVGELSFRRRRGAFAFGFHHVDDTRLWSRFGFGVATNAARQTRNPGLGANANASVAFAVHAMRQ